MDHPKFFVWSWTSRDKLWEEMKKLRHTQRNRQYFTPKSQPSQNHPKHKKTKKHSKTPCQSNASPSSCHLVMAKQLDNSSKDIRAEDALLDAWQMTSHWEGYTWAIKERKRTAASNSAGAPKSKVKSVQYPKDPCMVYLPTFGWFLW